MYLRGGGEWINNIFLVIEEAVKKGVKRHIFADAEIDQISRIHKTVRRAHIEMKFSVNILYEVCFRLIFM